jgi:hypothetical protein
MKEKVPVKPLLGALETEPMVASDVLRAELLFAPLGSIGGRAASGFRRGLEPSKGVTHGIEGDLRRLRRTPWW